MQCQRCGTLVPDGSKFCASCGSQVTDPSAATQRVSSADVLADPLLATLRQQLAGEYDVERELGRGGMAIVFKATEIALHRAVALKVLPPEMAVTPSISERFKREARMAASLDHPNIIDVYRVGQAGGISYIAMKYVEGRALDEVIESQGALPLPAVLLIMRSAVSALAAAHERGIIHRDIKGGNILLDLEGRVTVSDFGIARAVEEATLTASGAVIGTPYFMAPEQCAGLPLGPQVDQYAMGIVTFQMLTGSVPFKADSMMGIMHHHFSTPVPDLGSVRAGIPAALLAVVHRALSKTPEERYATTYDMLAAVEAVPFSDADRREAEAVLRRLARKSRVSKVDAGPVTTPPPSYLSARRESLEPATLPPAPAGSPPAIAVSASPPLATPAPRAAGPASAPVRSGGFGRLILIAATIALLVGGGWFVYSARFSPQAWMDRGTRLYAAGRREAARGWFQKAARARPRLVEPHLYLARIARDDRDYPLARQELERALSLEPRNATTLREMGGVMFAAGRYELARRFYVRALQERPDDPVAQGYLGCALVQMGRVDEGRRFVRRAGPGAWSSCAP